MGKDTLDGVNACLDLLNKPDKGQVTQNAETNETKELEIKKQKLKTSPEDVLLETDKVVVV